MKRLWLDANVILRFLTGEPEDMHERSVRLMAKADRGEVRLFVPHIVAAEVVWVLKSFYNHPMAKIADVFVAFISAPGVEVEDRDLLIQAMNLSRDKNVDFIDAVLALQAAAQDEEVCTFDKTDFKRLPVRWVLPEIDK